MSGGHFDYKQYCLGMIADSIEQVMRDNDSEERNEWGDRKGRGYTEATLEYFANAVYALKVAQVYAQRVDWLLCGDDGEGTFHERLTADLRKLMEDEA